MTREQKIKSPINDRNMIQGKMSYLQEINKDDQLDNWIIFGTVETFLFFTFSIHQCSPDWQPPSYTHCLSSYGQLWLQSEEDIWPGHPGAEDRLFQGEYISSIEIRSESKAKHKPK